MLKKVGGFIYETIQSIVVMLSIFVFIYFAAAQPHQVQGDSMLPNFISGEYIITDKITYRFVRSPERGDVIVFKAPNNPRRDYIKRVIALPGESVSVNNNQITVNNKPLFEGYLSSNENITGGAYLRQGASLIVPKGKFFVLGDNRDQSQDSRTFGPITANAIVGRVFFRYWPPQEIGKVEAVNY